MQDEGQKDYERSLVGYLSVFEKAVWSGGWDCGALCKEGIFEERRNSQSSKIRAYGRLN